MSTDLLNRFRLAQLTGKQFGGDRDLYDVLGYKRAITPKELLDVYYREDIAQRIVDAFPAATWRAQPIITEDEERADTEFELAIDKLVDNKKLWHYCERADRMSGQGRYGILILGINDNLPLNQPAMPSANNELIWLKPVTEAYAPIHRWEENAASSRYGLPVSYRVEMGTEESTTRATTTVEVHHSRVIHIAEKTGMDDVFGIPRLEPVYNRLFDLQKVVGGSAEMFWLSARQGLVFKANPDAQITDIDALEDDAETFQHQVKRILMSEGGEWSTLESQTPDPRGNVEVILNLIAGAVGIPQRILVGSESGELASSQDENNWLGRIEERRNNFADPCIVRQVIDRLILLEVIAPPKSGDYLLEFPPQSGLSELAAAQIGEVKARTLATYSNTIGSEDIVPPEEFREKMLGFEPEPPGGFPEPDEDDELDDTLPPLDAIPEDDESEGEDDGQD